MVRKKTEGNEEQRRDAARRARSQDAAPSARKENPAFGPGTPDYTEEHEQVMNVLAEAQDAHGGEGVYVDEVARRAAMSRGRVRALLHDLSAEHRLVTQLQGSGSPDLGPRFAVKPHL